MNINLRNLSIGEEILTWIGVSLPFVFAHSLISLGWMFGPPPLALFHIAGLFAIIPCIILYNNDKFRSSIVRIPRRLVCKYITSNRKGKSLHEVYPSIINWEDGDKMDIMYHKENGKFVEKRFYFASISGSDSIIVKNLKSYNSDEYIELSLENIVGIDNISHQKRKKEERTEHLKKKAKKSTEYEVFLHEREEALDEIRQISYENRGRLDSDI